MPVLYSLLVVCGVIAKVHDQAFLASGHRNIDLGKDFGIQQGAMQGPMRIIDTVAFAQGVEVVLFPRMQFLGHVQGIQHAVAYRIDRKPCRAGQVRRVEEANIKRGVMDDQFGSSHEIKKLCGDFGSVLQEIRG